MKILTLINHKGGIGKTALGRFLADYLVACGKRVLVVDLDEQGTMSSCLRRGARVQLAPFDAAALYSQTTLPALSGSYVLIPSNWDSLIKDVEMQHERRNDLARMFQANLQRYANDFDVCIIDTKSGYSLRLQIALVFSTHVLSPLPPTQEAIDGIHWVLRGKFIGIENIRAALNPSLVFLGMVPMLVEQTKTHKENMEALAQKVGHLFVRTKEGDAVTFPKRSCVLEAQASGELVWEMKKTAARDTWRLIEPTLSTIATKLFSEGVTFNAR